MRKRVWGMVALLAAMLCGLSACSPKTHYVIGYAPRYQEIGLIAENSAKNIVSLPVQDEKSGLSLLEDGQIQLTIADAAMVQAASKGHSPFSGQPVKDIQTILQYYPETMQMVAIDSADQFKVLKQKRLVIVGEEGGVASKSASPILAGLGINPETVIVTHLEEAEALKALKNRQVDALVKFAALPDETIKKALRMGCEMVDLPASIIQSLPQDGPAWTVVSIPGTVYKTLDVASVAYCSVVLCGVNTPDEVGKRLTTALLKEYPYQIVPDIESNVPAYSYNTGSRMVLDQQKEKEK